MPSIYQPRRPRASLLWQIVHHGWDDFLAGYEQNHRKTLEPLRTGSIATVEAFLRCGDLASGFTRFHCPDCGHEKLLAFTCKGRHFCPACHQRRVRTAGAWIATSICHEVPHRQFVFTIPKVLRGIFRKRRHLLTHLFHTATSTLQEAFRTRLDLADGRIGAVAAVHTFGDYLIFHPRLHILAADGLFAPDGTFHCMPDESLAAAIDHLPPKGQQTVRYYGIYSNKSRGIAPPAHLSSIAAPKKQLKPKPDSPKPIQMLLIPAPPKRRACDMRPLWRDLILKVWGGDPLRCPCCHGALAVIEP